MLRSALGTNDLDANLVTACSCRQYAKNSYDRKVLGWEVAPPSDDSTNRDGLKGLETGLKEAVRRLSIGPYSAACLMATRGPGLCLRTPG